MDDWPDLDYWTGHSPFKSNSKRHPNPTRTNIMLKTAADVLASEV